MTSPQEFREQLRGPVVAVTTPFRADYSLDYDGLSTLVDFYCESGIGPLIIAGSTGEFYSMTQEERKQVITVAVETADGRLPIIAGSCSHSGTHLAIDMMHHAQKVGASGAMITPPYYQFSGFEGLTRHYQMINDETDLGILIYFSGAVLHQVQDIIANPQLLLELGQIPNVVGFKDSTGNFFFLRDVSIMLKDKIAVLASSGLGYYMWGWEYGCPGFITGLGNIWPKKEIEFWQALESGNRDKAQQITYDYDRPYISFIKNTPARYNYWAAVKALLDMEGLPGGHMRPPLLDWPKEDLPTLRAEMVRIGLMKE